MDLGGKLGTLEGRVKGSVWEDYKMKNYSIFVINGVSIKHVKRKWWYICSTVLLQEKHVCRYVDGTRGCMLSEVSDKGGTAREWSF